ncbi:M50 family metallopeptidase [Fulvivirga lutimaris]|uniref:M50 family metallopeptidase n=1 Tax=Fulvivirga lutimaris TaxID=1819566 RepID=UPI0012BBE488|nr:M50 family metallopeptidase [Fulvivirga lutimaris]MTI41458.1 M50 family peptidase [Fulvivirga lutimaris]
MEKAIIISSTIATMFLVLGIHELGHLITGLWQGFRFDLFVVGPLGIKRDEEKIKIYFNKDLAAYGGLAASSPSEDHPNNIDKLRNVIIAGPIASMLLGFIGLLIYLLAAGLTAKLALVTALGSFGIFLATTVPSKTGVYYTDRKRYQRLSKLGKVQDIEMAMLRVMGSYNKNGSYKEIDIKDLELITEDDSAVLQYYGYMNIQCYSLERGIELSAEAKEKMHQLVPTLDKNMVNLFDKEVEKYRLKLEANQ